MKQKHFINTHKAATGPVILLMMAMFSQWQNPTAWIYLALHGTYGFLWVMKSLMFPSKSWEKATGWGYGLVIWGGLTFYWVAPWILMSQGVQTPPWYLGVCVCLYVLGVFLHLSTDMQKHTSLKLQPERLITDGMMARSRNLNYFGELLIYLCFGLLAMHWVPIVILSLFVAIIWLPYMLRKDKSLSRYATFEEYRRRSKLFIPFLF